MDKEPSPSDRSAFHIHTLYSSQYHHALYPALTPARSLSSVTPREPRHPGACIPTYPAEAGGEPHPSGEYKYTETDKCLPGPPPMCR